MKCKKRMEDVVLIQRIISYLAILVGYFFYCYNFVIIDYVRPYIIEEYHHISLADTAQFYTLQSVGALIGAIACAPISERIGKKRTLIIITAINGAATVINLLFTDSIMWSVMRFIIGISLGGYFTVSVSTMIGLFSPNIRGKLVAFASSMFSIALMIMGIYATYIAKVHAPWQSLMWIGGIPPIVAAIVMIFVIPNEKNIYPYGYDIASTNNGNAQNEKKGSWKEMFSKPHYRITIICIVLSGLNFYGYQFFNGFVTTYLKEVRHFNGETMGVIFSISSLGSLVGAWIWGIISDKWGRKVNAIGFIVAGIMASFFFIAPSHISFMGINLLAILGLVYNFGLASSAIWGGYFSELFPAHLRSFGASLFHCGRILGMWAPMVLVFIQNRTDLSTAMWGSPIVWIIGGILWFTLPETLKQKVSFKKSNKELC